MWDIGNFIYEWAQNNRLHEDTAPRVPRGTAPLKRGVIGQQNEMDTRALPCRTKMMGIIDWFKRASFDGMIRRLVGEYESPKRRIGNASLRVEEMEKKWKDHSMYRFSVTFKGPGSFSSQSVVLADVQIEELIESGAALLKRRFERSFYNLQTGLYS